MLIPNRIFGRLASSVLALLLTAALETAANAQTPHVAYVANIYDNTVYQPGVNPTATDGTAGMPSFAACRRPPRTYYTHKLSRPFSG